MFDLYNVERLAEWKKFRDRIETSSTPFEDLADFWAPAPFVSRYLDPKNPKSWPDPWKLIIDGKFDDLAICLGMLYTLKLTKRFRNSLCEIYTVIENNEKKYFLLIDNSSILNYEYRSVNGRNDLVSKELTLVWSKPDKL